MAINKNNTLYESLTIPSHIHLEIVLRQKFQLDQLMAAMLVNYLTNTRNQAAHWRLFMTQLSKLTDCWVQYKRRAPATCCNLNLRLELGHIYGLFGRNGSGKSTIIKLLAGLITPIRGTAAMRINGRDYLLPERNVECLSEIFTVTDHCSLPDVMIGKLGRLIGQLYPRFSQDQYHEYLAMFHIRGDQRTHQLSYGQKRKVNIALGVASNTALTLLDEPSNGLDVESLMALRKILINNISEERTFLISTHQVNDFQNIMDRYIVVDRGQVICERSAQELDNDSRQEELVDWYTEIIQAKPAALVPRNF